MIPSNDRALPSIPPDTLQIQVLGQSVPDSSFLYGGYTVSEGLCDTLKYLGCDFSSFRRILDLGCGASRVLRWFVDTGPALYGTDISRDAIAWNKANVPGVTFSANDPEPPTEYPDEYFDLIYAVSVVTHLNEQLQLSWLKELNRLLRPNGLAVLTTMGERIARTRLSESEMNRFREHGTIYKRIREGGLHGLPDFYQDAYHSRSYIEGVWSEHLAPRLFVAHGAMYLQDLTVLQKTSDRPSYQTMDLPIGVIDFPEIGSTTTVETLQVSGWTFRPEGPAVELGVFIDGHCVANCTANRPRPDVGAVFACWAPAETSGYCTELNIADLAPGPHSLKIAVQENSLPYISTFFFVE